MLNVVEELRKLASVDLLKECQDKETFVGRPFYFDYSTVKILVNDSWKSRAGGIPAGCFLVCVYDNETPVRECVLVRVIGPTTLPTDPETIASMVDYYKEDLPTGATSKLDSYTRYEFNFSGLECRVLGTFYEMDGQLRFGADVENFFSANNYSVYKPQGRVLELIVNFRQGLGVPGGEGDVRIGRVRYSSSRRYASDADVPVYVSAFDFVGKRTALFGMTRTGKSNTVKKIIQATISISDAKLEMEGQPLLPIGQIIFDVNGEYANANRQDEGTAIFQQYVGRVTRYSIIEKPDFKVMKLNFLREIEAGFGVLASLLAEDGADYVRSFFAVDLSRPPDDDEAAKTRWERKVAAYLCCLHAAGFRSPGLKIKCRGRKEVNDLSGIDPKGGVEPEEAIAWFTAIWEHYNDPGSFFAQERSHGREWADEDLKAILAFLTRRANPGAGGRTINGYIKLRSALPLHTSTVAEPFEAEIVKLLRRGEIVIVDLSEGDPSVQQTYAERICRAIFADAMRRFINNETPNYLQFYFEEAHNLFPRKEDKDLTQIYNRLAKEGAKLRLGISYATQEVSSISSNILKNTQNWFVSHLNNLDELKEIQKFYDYEDFVGSLQRATDQGFIRMKTYSNAFVVPVQIDRFVAK